MKMNDKPSKPAQTPRFLRELDGSELEHVKGGLENTSLWKDKFKGGIGG